MSPGREGPRGREGVCGELGNWGGAKCPPSCTNSTKAFSEQFEGVTGHYLGAPSPSDDLRSKCAIR